MVSTANLTDRQAEILAYVTGKIRGRGYGPTFREIGAEFGIRSPNGVMCHLKALEKKGVIIRDRCLSRAISLPESKRLSPWSLPFLGKVS